MKLFMRKIALLVMLAALLFGATSCSKEGATGKSNNVDYYTCTMHPSVHAKKPGKCPICSMDLVPVMKKEGGEAMPQPQGAEVKGGEKKGPLLSIYSPDLLTSEREFVELLRMRDQAKSKDARETPQRLIESARRRLQLWNVTEQQIADLEKTRKSSDTLTLLSPFRGVV